MQTHAAMRLQARDIRAPQLRTMVRGGAGSGGLSRDDAGHSAMEVGRAAAMTIGSGAGVGRIATALAQRAKHAMPPPSFPPQPESGVEGCVSLAAMTSIACMFAWLA